jgi:hypothetical protein
MAATTDVSRWFRRGFRPANLGRQPDPNGSRMVAMSAIGKIESHSR